MQADLFVQSVFVYCAMMICCTHNQERESWQGKESFHGKLTFGQAIVQTADQYMRPGSWWMIIVAVGLTVNLTTDSGWFFQRKPPCFMHAMQRCQPCKWWISSLAARFRTLSRHRFQREESLCLPCCWRNSIFQTFATHAHGQEPADIILSACWMSHLTQYLIRVGLHSRIFLTHPANERIWSTLCMCQSGTFHHRAEKMRRKTREHVNQGWMDILSDLKMN